MKVVDEQDGRPVAGALVLFHASAHEGTFTGHGGRQATLFVAETVTDESGELSLPRQEFSTEPFFLNTNYHNPSMVMFKPGYALVILSNARRIIAERQDLSTWEHNNQTIRMRRTATDTDTSCAVRDAAMYAGLTMGGVCPWKTIPRFLLAVDRSADEWNRRRASVADAALRRVTASSPLQQVLMNDAYFVEKGCGSPKAFFEPHLR